ncbi:MAG: RNA polymerase factor sigma-32 [Alphaproteobacteria bacterium]|jgi:RNA polymerase sigma-32 factor|nr:RNA polymerase factor sigma-32 [Alphaproteobacteria bacterium]
MNKMDNKKNNIDNKGIQRKENASLSVYDPSLGIKSYLKMVKSIPRLSIEEEKKLAIAFRDDSDIGAAQKLVQSHLYLSTSIAFNYKNYSLPLEDLISEANIGLMKAVKKFDVDKGFRLSTYASWWIKAELHDYILSNWSLIKIDKSAANKTLFFNFTKKLKDIGINYSGNLTDEEIKKIADHYSFKQEEIMEIENRRKSGGGTSLNKTISSEGDSGTEIQDLIASEQPNQEEIMERISETDLKRKILGEFVKTINDKEKVVITGRFLSPKPKTLEEIGNELKVSKERVRQIEVAIKEKLKKFAVKNYNYRS